MSQWLEGRVRDVARGGEAVVETERGVVFAPGALPNERVRVLLAEGKRGRMRAKRLEVLEPSQDRVVPACPHVERCGGCPLMHAAPQAQDQLKQSFLRDALEARLGPLPIELSYHPVQARLGYRRRARMSFRAVGAGRRLGFFGRGSKDLVDIDHCAVMKPELGRALAALRTRVLTELAGDGEVRFALGRTGSAVLTLRCELPQSAAVYAACEALVADAEVAGVALLAGGATAFACFGDATEWSRGADGSPLQGSVGGFSQAHEEANQALVQRVVELAQVDDKTVLELYAGHGNFTVALAGRAARYSAVELDAAAVKALRENLASRGLGAKVIEADAAASAGKGPLDVLLLDPPRAGAEGVVGICQRRRPRRIVYVSCSPVTLARDVAALLAEGYALASAEGFDMFPQTADLESVVLLERR